MRFLIDREAARALAVQVGEHVVVILSAIKKRAPRAAERARIHLDLVQAVINGRPQREQRQQLQSQLDDVVLQLQEAKNAISQLQHAPAAVVQP